jgi:hypothetical protein
MNNAPIGGGGRPGDPGPGFFFVNKFGRNPDVDTASTPEDIWSGGGVYPWIDPAVPVELEVLSTGAGAANDTLAGTGAQTLEIDLLDSDGNAVTVPIDMDGANPVNIPGGPFTAHNRMLVATAGASEENEGQIVLRTQGGGTTYGIIDFNVALGGGAGQSLQAIYTVPAGKKGIIKRHWARLDKFPGTTAQGRIAVKPAGGAWNTKETFAFSEDNPHEAVYPDKTGIEISAGAQIKIEVFDVGANDAVIDAGFDIEGEGA